MLRTMKLYGKMRRQFGDELVFDAVSPADMFRAAITLIDGFEEELKSGSWRVVRGSLEDGIGLQEQTLHMTFGKTTVVHLIPARAAQGRGVGKILLGAVLIGAAFATGGLSIGASGSAFGVGTAGSLGGELAAGAAAAASGGIAFTGVMGFAAKIGLVMMLGGISNILTPKVRKNKGTERNESFLFSGAINTASQGDCVPVVYGRIRAGSRVIAASLDVEQIQIGSSTIHTPDMYTGTFQKPNFNYPAASKGGKSGKRNSSTESPNNLQSNATVRLIDLISEGPCFGLADQNNPLRSVYLDDVPIADPVSGSTYNFQGVLMEERYGDPTQTPMEGFSNVETEVDVSTEVTHDTPVIRTVNDTNVNSIRLTMNIPALYSVDSNSGSMNGSTVEFYIEVQPSGGSYSEVMRYRVTGKTNAVYQVALRFALTGNGPWNIKVTRATADSTTSYLSNETHWSSYTEIVEHKLFYPNSALVGITADAKQFGSHIPNRSYDYKGRIVKVPSNYDTSTRKYTGVWDGTFNDEWTDNASWVFYDILTQTRYGLGDDVQEALLNKWFLYEIGQYCDEMVPSGDPTKSVSSMTCGVSLVTATVTGHGYPVGEYMYFNTQGANEADYNGEHLCLITDENTISYNITGSPSSPATGTITMVRVEPRYTINTQIVDDGEAWDLLNSMVSVFRGMFYWGSGQLEFSYDHDEEPSKIFSRSNVVGGRFDYSSGQYRSQHSVAIVGWNDPDLGGRLNYEVIEDRDLIATYGYKTIEVTAWGCTSRSQAVRTGRWILDTEKYGEFIAFTVSLDNADLRPGAVFEVNDPEYTTDRFGGRLADNSTTTVLQLDDSLTKSAGGTVRVQMPDGTLEERTVTTGAGSTTTLTLSSALSAAPNANAQFSYTEAGYDNKLWRVISVEETDTMNYNVYGIYHDPNKFPRVEQDVDLLPNNFSNIPTGPLTPPSNIDLVDYLFRDGTTVEPGALFSWDAPIDPRVTYYEWQVKSANDDDWSRYGKTSRQSVDLRPMSSGDYDIRVRSCNDAGERSMWIMVEDVTLYAITIPPADVTGLTVTKHSDSMTTTLDWDSMEGIANLIYGALTVPDHRPLKYRVFYHASSTDFNDAVEIALTDSTSLIIAKAGKYWVRTEVNPFILADNPVMQSVATTDFYDPSVWTNFNARNDRDDSAVVDPTIATDGTAVDSILMNDGSATISFEWSWAGTEYDIDGFRVYYIEKQDDSDPTLADFFANFIPHMIYMPANARSVIVPGLSPENYYTFAVGAYRIVDPDVNVTGHIVSNFVKPTFTGTAPDYDDNEAPYRPKADGIPEFLGDILGTIDGVDATVVGAATGNFNARNDRNASAVTAPTINNDGTAIDHTLDSSGLGCDISFEWNWGGTESDIDGYEVVFVGRSSSSEYVIDTTPAIETKHLYPADVRNMFLYKVDPVLYWTFYVRAYRIVDPDVDSDGLLYSSWVKSAWAGTNPEYPAYHPATSVAYTGNITGTINGVAASTVTSAVSNFNTRNDQDATAVVTPTCAVDGTCIDHTINTDGSADISFEWAWAGTEADIDLFDVVAIGYDTNGYYQIGDVPYLEQHFSVPPNVRHLLMYGVGADLYWTFYVRATRLVDDNINSEGRLSSSFVHSRDDSGTTNGYLPTANVAFTGDISSTVGYAPNTSVFDGKISIYCNWVPDIVDGQDWKYQLYHNKASTDKTTNASWSVTSNVGLTCTVGASTGIVTVTGFTSLEGYSIIESSYEGVTLKHVITSEFVFTKFPAITATDQTPFAAEQFGYTGFSSTTVQVVSDTLFVKTGANGNILCQSLVVVFPDDSSSGSLACTLSLDRRPAGGSWSQVATAAATAAAWDPVYPRKNLRYVSDNATGLSANSWYEYRTAFKNPSSGKSVSLSSRAFGALGS